MAELALALAALLLILGWRLGDARPPVRAAVLAVQCGFGFWYWLPAANVLLIHYYGDGSLPVARAAATAAAWRVLLFHAAALAALAVAVRLAAPERPVADRAGPPPALGVALLVSALLLVAVRFHDPRLVLRILAGAESARDHLTFFNRSASVAESLAKLWEVVNLWTACFVVGWSVTARRALGPAALAAAAAVVVGFLGSGARLDLLMAAFSAAAALPLRAASGSRSARTPGAGAPRWRAAAVVAVLALPAGLAFAARFRAGPGPLHALANSLLVNNDMFSETAFVLARLPGYAPRAPFDFLLTPFTYMLPHFLGFERAIPEHLVRFNMVRAGIDLVHGQGNVFPGIVGDYLLVFGAGAGVWAGAGVFAGLLLLFTGALALWSRLVPRGAPSTGYLVATAALLLASIRNTQGSIVLLMIGGVLIANAAALLARRR